MLGRVYAVSVTRCYGSCVATRMWNACLDLTVCPHHQVKNGDQATSQTVTVEMGTSELFLEKVSYRPGYPKTWTTEESWFDFQKREGIFLISKTSRLALGPILSTLHFTGRGEGVKLPKRVAEVSDFQNMLSYYLHSNNCFYAVRRHITFICCVCSYSVWK